MNIESQMADEAMKIAEGIPSLEITLAEQRGEIKALNSFIEKLLKAMAGN